MLAEYLGGKDFTSSLLLCSVVQLLPELRRACFHVLLLPCGIYYWE